MLRSMLEVPSMDCKSKVEPGAAAQHAHLPETVCQLGCGEDEAAFDEKLKAVMQANPGTETSKTDAG